MTRHPHDPAKPQDSFQIPPDSAQTETAQTETAQPIEVEPISDSHVEPTVISEPQNWIDRLLSPQSLQWMMTCGGGLLVIGFATWLWSVGVFENALVLAITVGGINLALLLVGIWLHQATRFILAGRGMVLLSCLVLPLNIWLYNSQKLIVLSEGGPLWAPALICCCIYALVARITRDSMFVYTLVSGVLLTGLLFLAGPRVGLLFVSFLPTATFFICVAVACIHTDRRFIEKSGAFSRQQFGRAFFRSGHVVLAAALVWLMIGLFWGLMRVMGLAAIQTPQEILWTITLVAVATYLYLYSHFTRKAGLLFPVLALLTFGWLCQLTLQWVAVEITFHIALLLLAIVTLTVNMLAKYRSTDSRLQLAGLTSLEWSMPLVASSLVACGLGEVLLRIPQQQPMFINWVHFLATGTAVIACWTSPRVWARTGRLHASCIELGFVGLAVLAVVTISVFTQYDMTQVALISLSVPVLTLFTASMITNEPIASRVGKSTRAVSTTISTLWLTLAFCGVVPFATWPAIGLLTSVAALHLITSILYRNANTLIPAGLAFGIAVAQFMVLFGITDSFTQITMISAVGAFTLAIAKIMQQFAPAIATDPTLTPELSAANGTSQQPYLHRLVERAGCGLLVAGSVAAIGHAISQYLTSSGDWSHILLLALQPVLLTFGMLATKDKAWQQVFAIFGFTAWWIAVAMFMDLDFLSFNRRLEIAALGIGGVLVAWGFAGWKREGEQKSDTVTVQFFVGTACLVLPMMAGLCWERLVAPESGNLTWRYVHEIGSLVLALALLGSGVLARIKAATLGGALLLVFYVLSSLFLVPWPEQLKQTSVLMMLGGGAFFTMAVLLSMYRERFLALPKRIRNGEGLYAVLKWR